MSLCLVAGGEDRSYLGLGSFPGRFWEWIPAMPHGLRISTRVGRRIALFAETLESRTLLSATGRPDVAIDVPSTYISQQSSQLDVTLVRAAATARKSLTVNFSATSGSVTAISTAPDTTGQPFTPVNATVTFPAGQTTENVVVPINSQAVNSGLVPIQLTASSTLVPIQLTASSTGRQARGNTATLYLASSLAAIPPSITGVQRVAGGIAVTFSKPMAPATALDVHNYSVRFAPNQKFSLENLYGVGLVQALDTSKKTIPLRRATYDSATNTVTLIPNEPLGPNGSYVISNPPSLLSKKARPNNAQPLTDLEGNVLNQGGKGGGTFSVTISKGKPYAVASPVLFDGN
jgi:hypothetical protein